ncbi:ADL385Cp [Eremothecium gossypii ATCC 10895]|uniref:5-formyltetrahydrofolate cyclo-ligase n=1 Tax=Eremothecium gossypii (strain ATCC 10895 / CBS 109.51 / FGSC 9923 / NRRL Y-1056) TaxID=284811 RepID=Q75BE9_EREGS|nr:ADL385Cp [Eremothecium gossypii ATCC 10895]AAS51535.1 ADL385Cp [Eremothecium gossypii ATCC 10895]AEY95831.1 FADL385Cp [Eremothecium gossypii FDAG1]
MSKRTLRTQLKQALDAVPKPALLEQGQQVLLALEPVLQQHRSFACYLNMDSGEAPTEAILERLFQLGKDVYLPRCTDSSASGIAGAGSHMRRHLTFYHMQSMAAVRALRPQGKYGLREPPAEAPPPALPDVDVVLMPGLGFCADTGARLGRGAGYYDNYVSRTQQLHGRRPLLVGLALSQQLMLHVPLEPHDQCLDAVACGDGQLRWAQRAPGEIVDI